MSMLCLVCYNCNRVRGCSEICSKILQLFNTKQYRNWDGPGARGVECRARAEGMYARAM